jgi:hypothetical protein
MMDRAQAMARVAVDAVAYLLESLRGEVTAWIYDGDVSFILVMAGVAMVMMLMIVVPRRRHY